MIYPHDAVSDEIFPIFQKLSEVKKEILLAFTLRGCKSGEGMTLKERVADILGMNAIPLWYEKGVDPKLDRMMDSSVEQGDKEDEEDEEDSEVNCMGIFEKICRVNHSCTPNAGWTWDKMTGKLSERP